MTKIKSKMAVKKERRMEVMKKESQNEGEMKDVVKKI